MPQSLSERPGTRTGNNVTGCVNFTPVFSREHSLSGQPAVKLLCHTVLGPSHEEPSPKNRRLACTLAGRATMQRQERSRHFLVGFTYPCAQCLGRGHRQARARVGILSKFASCSCPPFFSPPLALPERPSYLVAPSPTRACNSSPSEHEAHLLSPIVRRAQTLFAARDSCDLSTAQGRDLFSAQYVRSVSPHAVCGQLRRLAA